MKVFICEDDKDILELMQILLDDLNIQTDTSADLDEIIEKLSQYQPDLIIVDYWLRGVKADILIKEIREIENIKNIPILLISAINDLEKVASDLRVEGFIKKPFDIIDFKQTIQNFIK